MDEAGRLISELQQKLAQLDHKVYLYRLDMTTEFKKYADTLLRDVPQEVSATVNKAIAESLKTYPLLDLSPPDLDRPDGIAVNAEALENCTFETMDTLSNTAARAASLHDRPGSPTEGRPTSHEREQEFQGIFTPGYLPLLDSNDRNERRSSTNSASVSQNNSKPIDIVPNEKSADDTAAQSSSYPSSSSLPLENPSQRRRRSTDDGSNKSDHSDTPIRRSALRRIPSSSKPHSPRQVRFEFAGEEFLPTSSPKLEVPEAAFTPRSPIILGMGGTEELLGDLELPQVDDSLESPPKRITSSQALRLLSRGPLEDDGTQWTEVIAPFDGSASVPKVETAAEDSDDEILSMPVNVAIATPKLNGYKEQDSGTAQKPPSGDIELASRYRTAYSEEHDATRNGVKTPEEVAEEEDILADIPRLSPNVANANTNTKSSSTFLRENIDRSQGIAIKSDKKPWFILPDGTDLNDFKGMTTKLDVDLDDEDMFAFDEAADRPYQNPPNEPDTEDDLPESPVEETAGAQEENVSQFATSPHRPIPQAGSMVGENSHLGPSTPHRSSYHPFNTPIVNAALHEQAASLGHVPSFVGSVKDGLEEMALQSFRGGGNFGGVPRSLSEKMAFDEAMEAQREATKKM